MTESSARRLPRPPASAGPVVGFAAITATALLAAPAIAAQLASEFRLLPSQIGLYFAVEQGGMCLAALPAMWWLKHVSWRRAAGVAMGIFMLANLLSARTHGMAWLLPLRGVSALSGGSLMVLSMTLASRSSERERLFGLWTLGQLVVGALLLFFLPRLFARFGLSFLYLLLAGLMAAAIPLLAQLPPAVVAAPSHDSGRRMQARTAVQGLGGVFLYYLGFGGVWPFMAAIAKLGGATAVDSGSALALASLFGVGGAFLATVLARRGGQFALVVGYGAQALALFVLLHEPSVLRFAIAGCLLKGGSNFSLPFILGRVASLDVTGRLMALTNIAIGGGLATGPLVAGVVVERLGGPNALIGSAVFDVAASALLIVLLKRAPTAAFEALARAPRGAEV